MRGNQSAVSAFSTIFATGIRLSRQLNKIFGQSHSTCHGNLHLQPVLESPPEASLFAEEFLCSERLLSFLIFLNSGNTGLSCFVSVGVNIMEGFREELTWRFCPVTGSIAIFEKVVIFGIDCAFNNSSGPIVIPRFCQVFFLYNASDFCNNPRA